MPSRDAAPLLPLIGRELRALFAAGRVWALLFVVGPAVGARLWWTLQGAQGSTEGEAVPVLAAPFAAQVLVVTLLFPFVVTKLAGADKKSGALGLLWQLGHAPLSIVVAKACALVLALVLALAPLASMTAALSWAGAHVHAPALAVALLGHLLYGAWIIGVGVAAAALTENAAAAALLALAVVGGAWAVDSAGAPGARFMPSASVRVFESGVLEATACVALGVGALGLLMAGAALLAPASTPEKRAGRAGAALVAMLLFTAAGSRARGFVDVTEGKRNSLAAPVADAAAHIGDPVRATVRLRADDPRFLELQRDVLWPLGRVATVEVKRVDVDDRRYGLVSWQVGTRGIDSRATTRREVLPLVFDLAGVKAPTLVDAGPRGRDGATPYSGGAPLAWVLCFGVWPLAAVGGAAASRRKRDD